MRRLPALLLLGLIRVYQLSLGRILGGSCRFHPSCSEFAAEAVRLNGALVGGGQTAWRLLRCGPWSKGGVDRPRRRLKRVANEL